jgi:hypothetical protein
MLHTIRQGLQHRQGRRQVIDRLRIRRALQGLFPGPLQIYDRFRHIPAATVVMGQLMIVLLQAVVKQHLECLAGALMHIRRRSRSWEL